MAFLGKPTFELGAPVSVGNGPGIVEVRFSIPLFVERLERCFSKVCDEAKDDTIFAVTAEIWSHDDDTEPFGTFPISNRSILTWRWFGNTSGGAVSRNVRVNELGSGTTVVGSPGRTLLNLSDSGKVLESLLNEDFGPRPPRDKPAPYVGRDEVYLKASLASVFSGWQVIQTINSEVKTGDFFGN